MILSSSSIRALIKGAFKIITPEPSEERSSLIESCVYDLSLASISRVRPIQRYTFGYSKLRGVFIGVNEREIPEVEILPWIVEGDGTNTHEVIHCDTGYSYILQSEESIKLPAGIMCLVLPKTSIFRGGGIEQGTTVPFGFEGQLVVGFSIPSKACYFTFERGCRFATLLFMKVDSSLPVDLGVYNGIWGGDKLTTNGRKERSF